MCYYFELNIIRALYLSCYRLISTLFSIFFDGFVSSSVLRITCGRTNALILQSLRMTWAIGFALPCVKDGFRTSSKPIRMVLPLAQLGHRLDRTLWLCRIDARIWSVAGTSSNLLQWTYTRPNRCFQFWNNANNSINHQNNSKIIQIKRTCQCSTMCTEFSPRARLVARTFPHFSL